MGNFIGIINGPNLGRLGLREPELYGYKSLKDLEAILHEEGSRLGVEVECFQSDHEGEIISKINVWSDSGTCLGVVINPAAYSHTSVGIYDAIRGSALRFIEVHISNIHGREEFRQKTLTGGACEGVISGLHFEGYVMALGYLVK